MRTTLGLLSCFFMVATIIGCQPDRKSELNAENLPKSTFLIDTERDTVLETMNGAQISIPKGALKGSGSRVEIRIREAYTIVDMIKAGLTTRSGGQALSSGGMIFIDAAEGNSVSITKPISIAIPTNAVNQEMQLYKGKEKGDGTIDWQNPVNLSANNSDSMVLRGKMLYDNDCSACHRVEKGSTGPSLAFMGQRHKRDWLLAQIRNSGVQLTYDEYANCLYKYYNKTQMTSFPDYTDADLDDLCAFIDKQSEKIDPLLVPNLRASYDSCVEYNRLTYPLLRLHNELVTSNGSEMEKTITQRPADAPEENGPGFKPDNLVAFAPERKEKHAEYYRFRITTFGWYNVDYLLEERPGFVPSTLSVKVSAEPRIDYHVYMAIPKHKILLDGGELKDRVDVYGFYSNDGKIPLPIGQKAIVFAIGSLHEKLYWGSLEFITSQVGKFELLPKLVTQQEIDSAIGSLKFDGIKIAVDTTSNAGVLRSIDSALKQYEILKPVLWDCRCTFETRDTAWH